MYVCLYVALRELTTVNSNKRKDFARHIHHLQIESILKVQSQKKKNIKMLCAALLGSIIKLVCDNTV